MAIVIIWKKFSAYIVHSRNRYYFLLVTIAMIGTWMLLVSVLLVGIRFEVKKQCQMAKNEYAGDCIDALRQRLEDTKRSFRSRNDAIWVLGQLGERRALVTLNKYYTGNIPTREPLDKGISQYELKKAIHLVSNGNNIASLFWRYGIE